MFLENNEDFINADIMAQSKGSLETYSEDVKRRTVVGPWKNVYVEKYFNKNKI